MQNHGRAFHEEEDRRMCVRLDLRFMLLRRHFVSLPKVKKVLNLGGVVVYQATEVRDSVLWKISLRLEYANTFQASRIPGLYRVSWLSGCKEYVPV